VKWDPPSFQVKVTGPRILVENLKDSDIRAEVDLSGQEIATGKTPPLVPKYSFPYLKPAGSEQIHVDWPNTIRVQLYVVVSKSEPVHVPTRSAPVGMHYERTSVLPDIVVCTGLESAVKRINRVIANVDPGPDGRIDGDYPVVALDKDERKTPDITCVPDHVRVSVPLVEDPPLQFAVVSPVVTSLPLPPYRVDSVNVDPARVKIIGRPGRRDAITSISTEDITLHDATADTDREVNLVVPPDVAVFDPQGRHLTRVHVHFRIMKVSAPPDPTSPSPDTGTQSAPGIGQ